MYDIQMLCLCAFKSLRSGLTCTVHCETAEYAVIPLFGLLVGESGHIKEYTDCSAHVHIFRWKYYHNDNCIHFTLHSSGISSFILEQL